ncbi:MAG: hypothetical protein KBT03_09710 [Bacteroidales bacterium]|nr:hypothetical protein [Candidatus Scybalousia scybalohippi]
MQWEELKKKAKELGAEIINGYIVFRCFCFYADGTIDIYKNSDDGWELFIENRTYEQILMIMEALR